MTTYSKMGGGGGGGRGGVHCSPPHTHTQNTVLFSLFCFFG